MQGRRDRARCRQRRAGAPQCDTAGKIGDDLEVVGRGLPGLDGERRGPATVRPGAGLAVPATLSEMVCGEFGASSAIVRVAARWPVAVGSPMVHVAPGA